MVDDDEDGAGDSELFDLLFMLVALSSLLNSWRVLVLLLLSFLTDGRRPMVAFLVMLLLKKVSLKICVERMLSFKVDLDDGKYCERL